MGQVGGVGVTVPSLLAEVPFKAEQLVTRDGKRVDGMV